MADERTEAIARVWPLGLRIAHWLLAAATIGACGLALYLMNPPDWSDAYIQRYYALIDYHKAMGLIAMPTALALALQHGRRPARTGSENERLLAAIGQWILLAFVFVAAMSGYLADSLFGNSVAVPGLPVLPSPFPRTESLARIFNTIHNLSANGVLFVIAGHVAFAMWRQVFKKDDVISRILGVSRQVRD